jgi:N-acyl-D-aspartate/D-glutamate deacylase
MGNCGVGFAPVRPHDRDRLIELMEGVEDIPGAALHEGLTWEWESFGEYLDALDRRRYDIDVAAQVPHGAVRLYVMGERGANREPATTEEIAAMGAVVRDAVAAGALGFTTSRTLNHRTSRGEPTPTLTAATEELAGIAAAMGEIDAGVLEVVSDFRDVAEEFATLKRMVEVSGRPLSISLAQADVRPDQWRQVLDAIAAANAEGHPVKAQVPARAIGLLLGLSASLNPFIGLPAYQEVAPLPVEARVRAMRDPSFRERLLAQVPGHRLVGRFDRMFELGDPPDYEPAPEASLAARAAREGIGPEQLAYDLLLADEGRNLLYFPFLNYTEGNLDVARQMLVDEHTVPGLADGGAHVGTICDASFPTTLLAHWCRDRSRGERLDLASTVRQQARDTAAAVGLSDRGTLDPGMRADVNVIDFDRLRLRHPTMHFDLPAGGKRLLQRAEGYRHTIVAGEEVYADGEHTGALPGRLVRRR